MLFKACTRTLIRGTATAGLLLALAGCGGGSGGSSDPVAVALSGTIDIETGTRVDADNADALALSNTRLGSPQSLPAEYILAGYVSASAGAYPALPDFPATGYPADPDDTFSMRLRNGQTVELQAFATRAGASALRLTVDGVQSNVTTSTNSRISVTNSGADGSYTVRVESEGPTPMLYVLSTAVNPTGNAVSLRWPEHEFVEGEALVALNNPVDQATAQSMLSQNDMVPAQELAPGLWRVKAPVSKALGSGEPAAAATLDWIRALQKRPDIASATPNYQMQAMTPVDEPLYSAQQWHYGLLNAPTAWQLAPDGGEGVTVAVMDTGLYRGSGGWHSDIDANVSTNLAGSDFVSEQFDNDGQPGRDSNPADPGNSVGGSVYHGTHVAGTVAALINEEGGGGVAFNSTLLPVRVLGEGGAGSSADLLAALQWVGGPEGGQPRANIANLSLGGLPYIQSLQDAINTGTERGVIFVAAGGNAGTNAESYPAAFDNVFAVSAVDGAGDLASYSNFGNWIDVAAPGGDASRDGNADGRGDVVVSTSASVINGSLQETYIGLQGTSMAAPHVSAVMALMKNQNPALDYGAINAFLMAGELTVASCASPPCPKTSELGWGLLDAGKATSAALSAPITDLLTASPAIVSLSSEGSLSATVVLEVYGDNAQAVTIDTISEPPPWLNIEPLAQSEGTRFELPMSLNLDALEPGISERASIEITYRGGQTRTLEIPVVGQEVTDQQARDAGRHFVLLVDPEPEGGFYTTVAQTNVVAENGRYRFAFVPDDGQEPKQLNEVPPGNYILVAGTDLDNDALICHAGEACAEYPVAGLREEITVSAGEAIEGIRMTTSYSRPSISAASPDQLPRPGFRGYQLLSPNPDADDVKALAQP
ncbi:S8 family serine peptidase [Marinobacter sp. M216]|uniref:S8 family serine peptidase n=1 Tax=Marinobacter albus TaxID=3030833 RepID=A0ABT7HAW1_9GAMM|nr:S8 family serine peptidase [Marinobacter sp. M216]MDK9557119.1 S8 family serine peptidase [Marinobacter sp. M216]